MGLSREQLFRALHIVKDGPQIDGLTKRAMIAHETELWRSGGSRKTTSFFASQFPGEEKSCDRRLLYTLMNIPEASETNIKLRGYAEMGNAAEYLILHRWGHAGMTVGGSVPLEYGQKFEQVRFEDAETWLSGAADAVLDIRPDYDAVLPVDVKSKNDNVIDEMRASIRSYDPKHYMQIQAYIYFCKLYHDDMGWSEMGLKPARGATIYYVSRQDPTKTVEYYFPYSEEVATAAVELLKQTKEAFIENRLPPRPKEWKWSEEPCKWCPFKKFACKPDNTGKVETLSQSHGIEFAKEIIEEYDYDEIREAVFERWK